MPRRSLPLLALVTSLVLASHSASARVISPRPRPAPDPGLAVAQGVNGLGVALYAKVRGEPGNLVFSPASIAFALGMVHGGAAGDTARELERVLGIAADPGSAQAGFAALMKSGRAAKGIKLRIANRLWAQKGFAFAAPFVALTRDGYGAPLALADFVKNAEKTRVAINHWVESVTNQRIKDLLPAGSVQDAALVIVNAIWFKGEWAKKFDARATRDLPFTLLSGDKPAVKTMALMTPAGFAHVDGVSLVELDYKGGEMSMVCILPDDAAGLARMEERLTADQLSTWLGALQRHAEVDVQLPRWKAQASLPLGQLLQQLGVVQLFSEQTADLSGMLASGEKSLHVSGAFHKAFVAVDEEGAEAAAATGMVMTTESVEPPPPVFHADHPFVWLIRDKRSGLVYFMGRVVDPR